MSRNVTILVIILVILVVAGYLVWLKGKIQKVTTMEVTPTPVILSPTPEAIVTPTSASPSGSFKATTSATLKLTPTRTATESGEKK